MRLRRVNSSDPGLRRVRRGRGFSYLDDRGAPVTDAGVLERIRAMAIPPAWQDVWICARVNGHLQATGVDEAGRRQYLYHPGWQERMAREKFDRMLVLAGALPAARRGVTIDLRSGEPSREAVLAAAFRMLDTALLRVGSERYAREHGSVGLATLRGSHVKVEGETVRLRFPGKSGQPWESEIEDADLAAFIGTLRRGGRARLLAWRDEKGWHPLDAADINEDVRRRTGGDFTAKDFRTLHGTAIAARALAREEIATTGRARSRVIAGAVKEAAAALGNTPAVARASYIDPRLLDRYERGEMVDPGRTRSIEAQLIELLTGR